MPRIGYQCSNENGDCCGPSCAGVAAGCNRLPWSTWLNGAQLQCVYASISYYDDSHGVVDCGCRDFWGRAVQPRGNGYDVAGDRRAGPEYRSRARFECSLFAWDRIPVQRDLNRVNASVNWTSTSKRYDIALWGRNITGQEYGSATGELTVGTVRGTAPPATYFVTFGYHLHTCRPGPERSP